MNKFVSRKFLLAMLFGLVGSVGFLMGKELGAFTTFVGVVYGIFTGGDVGMNAIHKRGAGNPDGEGQ